MLRMGSTKPPIPVKVKNLENLARLALALTDSPPLLWCFKHKEKWLLATFSIYMSWKGDVPLLAYVQVGRKPGPFLAYRSTSEAEEYKFTSNLEDPKYAYAPTIYLKDQHELFVNAIEGKYPKPSKPLKMELNDLNSLLRLLYLVSIKEYTAFPLWYFRREGKHILGACIPFERYYEANALPVFFYVKLRRKPPAPFIKYLTDTVKGEVLDFTTHTGDTKYLYAKIIEVEDLPIFP